MLSNVDLEQILRNGWHVFTTWISTLYTEHPLLAWGATAVVLLFIFYRISRWQQHRAEQRAAAYRRRQKNKRASKRKNEPRRHNHAHDRREAERGNQDYRRGRRDRMDDWD